MSETKEEYEARLEAEIKLEKAIGQRNIASAAMVGLFVVMIYIFSPMAPSNETIEVLKPIINTFMISMASLAGAFMGFSAWMVKK